MGSLTASHYSTPIALWPITLVPRCTDYVRNNNHKKEEEEEDKIKKDIFGRITGNKSRRMKRKGVIYWGWVRRKEGNILFNDTLNTFYLWLYDVRHMAKDHSDSERGNRHIGYSYRLTARVLLYAPSHRQDSTYHGLCYTSRGALAGMRNSSMGPT